MKILCHSRGGVAACSGVCVYSSTLRRALVCHHSFSLSSFRQLPFSLLPRLSFFYQTLPTVSTSPSLCELSFPHRFISLAVFFSFLFFLPPICFLFSAVSGTPLLCFSSSDPTLEHLREIRRKLASENLQLEALVPHLLSGSQLSDQKTFRATRATEKRADRLNAPTGPAL